ncbi:AfsR/SARP family transcriptional regulator [Nocardia terpenica]|uniref:AfsR/SARP family transcriptional regulator n=1 Tax=Nocardia terpenica TaxID=455432 RepID=UPI0015C57BBD|nr:BTAD domain-containing putative transcriptional regulator [Nocardia terpenica]NQE91699.1 hypothetical protein [Nocardia terpenica]
MLIALAALHTGTGVTTTAAALAVAWPGPGTAVVVEADPAGGRLGGLLSGDPGAGLGSLARAARSPHLPVRLAEHARLLPSGVPVIAAPRAPSEVRAVLTAPVSAPGPDGSVLAADAVLIADCGLADPDSAALPLMAGADLLVVVVRADRVDSATRARLARLAVDGPPKALLLIGEGRTGEIAAALGVPVAAVWPLDPAAAQAIVTGDCTTARSGSLYIAARGLADTVAAQLIGSARPRCDRQRLTRWWRTRAGAPRRRVPGVYRLDTAVSAPTAAIDSPPGPAAEPPIQPAAAHGSAVVRGCTTGSDAPVRGSVEPTAVPAPSSAVVVPLAVEVFGRLRVLWNASPDTDPIEITRQLRPRQRELLTVLAVHPDGVTRDTLVEALWAGQNLRRPANALNTVLSRLRASVAAATGGVITDILDGDKVRYRLDPRRIRVDYRDFSAAVTALRTATSDDDRKHACRAILAAASGVLDEDFTSDWIAPIRENARRDRLNALGNLAQMLVDSDPRQTLALLETALVADPCNEPIYQDILRLHARLGEPAALNRTLALLNRRLQTIGDIPTQKTLDIARRLRDQPPDNRPNVDGHAKNPREKHRPWPS